MDSPIVISLVVSGIGMLMLFLALAFLCGLMYLMTAAVRDKPAGGVEEHENRDMRLRAAAIGVALARAEQKMITIGALEEGKAVSGWRMLHHQRQLTRRAPARRVK